MVRGRPESVPASPTRDLGAISAQSRRNLGTASAQPPCDLGAISGSASCGRVSLGRSRAISGDLGRSRAISGDLTRCASCGRACPAAVCGGATSRGCPATAGHTLPSATAGVQAWVAAAHSLHPCGVGPTSPSTTARSAAWQRRRQALPRGSTRSTAARGGDCPRLPEIARDCPRLPEVARGCPRYRLRDSSLTYD